MLQFKRQGLFSSNGDKEDLFSSDNNNEGLCSFDGQKPKKSFGLFGPGGLREPGVLACARRSLAIVITIVQSFCFSFSLRCKSSSGSDNVTHSLTSSLRHSVSHTFFKIAISHST